MQPGWCQPVRQEFMENECEALPGVAYPGVRDNRSTINTKTGYDDDDDILSPELTKFATTHTQRHMIRTLKRQTLPRCEFANVLPGHKSIARLSSFKM